MPMDRRIYLTGFMALAILLSLFVVPVQGNAQSIHSYVNASQQNVPVTVVAIDHSYVICNGLLPKRVVQQDIHVL